MMMSGWLKSRTSLITELVIAAAFLICGFAWMRFFAVAATNPSPVRYVEFNTRSGARAPFLQTCKGPSFVEGDVVWRFCAYDNSLSPEWGLVRFDLAHAEGWLLWPLPETPESQVLALAESAQGDLAAAWGSPDLAAVYLVLHEGGVIPLGLPSDALPDVLGLGWTADTLELVAQPVNPAGGDAMIYSNVSGNWTAARPVPVPAVCDAETLCALQAAYRIDGAWQFVYAAAPRTTDATSLVSIVQIDESGTTDTASTFPLSDLDPELVTLEGAQLTRLGVLFDRASGGAVNWDLRAAPFVLNDGTWERLTAPQGDARFFYADYQIQADGLRWLPGLSYPQRGWQLDQWLTLQLSSDGVILAEIGGKVGPTLTRDTTLLADSATHTTVVPASDGGYWVLGPNGAYIKVGSGLDRADGLNIVERVVRAFDNFGKLDDVNGAFYREKRAVKMAALPLVLLSLPIGYLLVFFVRQSKRSRRFWIALLLEVSAVYVVVATLFYWWFWKLMDNF